ncbi:MAG: 4Fe-4S cluster-binding domain-containing protein [Oscillospiraceae bacterium]|nr:4Fe-4S cluster-binding domain-containing protein [Candidatus Limimonas egerieequi]
MVIRTIVDEDFVQYKEPCMYIATAFCDGKCCKEANIPLSVCQNYDWRTSKLINMSDDDIIKRYIKNDITKAVCFAGFEPFEQYPELENIIRKLRKEYACNDTVIIYTGFNKSEVLYQVALLQKYENIIIKFGRYVPGCESHYDDVLGVKLASPNQYAEVIS